METIEYIPKEKVLVVLAFFPRYHAQLNEEEKLSVMEQDFWPELKELVPEVYHQVNTPECHKRWEVCYSSSEGVNETLEKMRKHFENSASIQVDTCYPYQFKKQE